MARNFRRKVKVGMDCSIELKEDHRGIEVALINNYSTCFGSLVLTTSNQISQLIAALESARESKFY